MTKIPKSPVPTQPGPAPSEAPPLDDLTALKEKFEERRADIFPWWKTRLEAEAGNITRASHTFFRSAEPSPEDKVRAKSYANWLTRALGLLPYAAELRVASGQPKYGRPRVEKPAKTGKG